MVLLSEGGGGSSSAVFTVCLSGLVAEYCSAAVGAGVVANGRVLQSRWSFCRGVDMVTRSNVVM